MYDSAPSVLCLLLEEPPNCCPEIELESSPRESYSMKGSRGGPSQDFGKDAHLCDTLHTLIFLEVEPFRCTEEITMQVDRIHYGRTLGWSLDSLFRVVL